MARPNPKEAKLMRARKLIKEIYSKLGGRSEELVIIHEFRVFRVKRANKEVTILQIILDNYFDDKRKAVQKSCIQEIENNLKNLIE
jgi:hypothetical protein